MSEQPKTCCGFLHFIAAGSSGTFVRVILRSFMKLQGQNNQAVVKLAKPANCQCRVAQTTVFATLTSVSEIVSVYLPKRQKQ